MKNFVRRTFKAKTIAKIEAKNKLLGLDSIITTGDFLINRLYLEIACFFIVTILFPRGYYIAFLGAVFIHYFSEFVYFDLRIQRRKNHLDEEALFFFEIFALNLESKKSIQSSLETSVNNVNSILADEIKIVLKEVKYGKPLNEALYNLKVRIPSIDINSIILNIIESEKYGNSLNETLNKQLEYLRAKKSSEVKKRLLALPLKLIFISLLFLIPIFTVIFYAPQLVNLLLK